MRKGLSESEWSEGWPVAAAGFVGMTLMALHAGVLGVMMKPLGEIFGWGRSAIAAGFTIMTLVHLFLLPSVSLVIPRIGIKRIALAGAGLYALGLFLLALSTSNIASWYIGWTVLGLGICGVSPLSWTTAVANAFQKHRGIALSITLSGVGVATFVSPIISTFAFDRFGWRAPFIALSLLVLVILLPVLWWLMRRARHFDPYELQPINDAIERVERGKLHIVADIRVWQMIFASFLLAACAGMIMIHLQAMLRDAGASVDQAATYFALAGPMLIVGRLVAGVMLDHLPTRLVATLLFLLPILCCFMLIGYDGTAFWGIFICIVFGVGYGSESDVLAYTSARYFGTRDYPFVYSLVYGAFGLGYGLAALLAGAMFDRLGSYTRILEIMIVGVAVGIALIIALGREPPPLELQIVPKA